jgi:hypothetical protein
MRQRSLTVRPGGGRRCLSEGSRASIWSALLAFRPLDQQPLFPPTVGETVITMRDTNVHARKARGQPVGRTFPPLDCAVDGGRNKKAAKLFVIRRQSGSSPPIEIRSGVHTIITGPPWLDFQLKSRGSSRQSCGASADQSPLVCASRIPRAPRRDDWIGIAETRRRWKERRR